MQIAPENPEEHRLKCEIYLACFLEATARKPGNVHPHESFADLNYRDFLLAAHIVSPILACARRVGVGRVILESVTRCREHFSSNVNLGIVLLMAPLAAVPPDVSLLSGIEPVLDSLTVEDAALVYEAIRLSAAGGLGSSDQQDVTERPTLPLRSIMKIAAGRDSIAAEYAEGFPLTLGRGLPLIAAESARFLTDWEISIVRLQLTLMSEKPDTLIARKCAWETANQSAELARQVLAAGWPKAPESGKLREEFDRWLRADGHRRNPGTTADIIAATLFAMFREGHVKLADPDLFFSKTLLKATVE